MAQATADPPKATNTPPEKSDAERLRELAERLGEVPAKSDVETLRTELATIKTELSNIANRVSSVPWSQRDGNKNPEWNYRPIIRALAEQSKGYVSIDNAWWKRNGYEYAREVLGQSRADYDHVLRDVSGPIVNHQDATTQAAGIERTTVVTTSGTLGGYLVPDEVGGYSDLLRARNPIFSKFGTEIIQTTGIPYKWNRMSTGATMTVVGEGAAITETSVAFDQDNYYPKKYAGYIPISMESILMGDPAIESAVRSELTGRASVNVATQFLIGTGVAGNPTGIFVDTRGLTYSTNVDPLTAAGLMGVIETLKTNNALLDGSRLGFVMHPFSESAIMALSQSGTGSALLFPSNVGNYASEGLGIYGIPYATTTVLGGAEGTSDLGLVDWSQHALLRWGVLQIDTNPNVQWLNDNLLIRVIDRINVLIRQPKTIVFVTALGKA